MVGALKFYVADLLAKERENEAGEIIEFIKEDFTLADIEYIKTKYGIKE
jgi:hypothetical protein